MNTKEIRFLTFFGAVTLVLLVIASFGDLAISKAVMDQNSIFGTFFQDFGMIGPGLIAFISSEIIFVYGLRKKNQFLKIVFAISGLGLAFWSIWGWVDGWMYYGTTTLNNLKAHAPIGAANNNIGAKVTYSFSLAALFVFLLWVIGTWIAYLWLHNKTDEQFKYLLIAAIGGIAVVYLTGSIVTVMKTNWGRFRPYEVKEIVAGAKGSFTNWWHLNGVTGHQSFPSGHELAAMTTVFLPFFVDRKNIKWQEILAYATVIYGALMGLARIRLGAHYLSDVTVSAMIVVFVVFVTMKVLGYSFIEETTSSLT